MSEDLCFDTNIILGYATDFEEKHEKCQTLFKDSRIKRTCSRVHSELGRVRTRRRNKIYENLLAFLNGNLNLDEFSPSVYLSSSDEGHLKDLLQALKEHPAEKILSYLRRKLKEIESGVQDALDKLARPFIGIVNDVACEASLNRSIKNMSDCKILSDALCWAEKQNRLIFCTDDVHDFVVRRDAIYNRIAEARSYEKPDVPLVILGLSEIVS